jgi:hypothetical protein
MHPYGILSVHPEVIITDDRVFAKILLRMGVEVNQLRITQQAVQKDGPTPAFQTEVFILTLNEPRYI